MPEIRKEENLIRPSRSKNRSKLFMLNSLLERQETVRELGKQLESAKSEYQKFCESAKSVEENLEQQEKRLQKQIEEYNQRIQAEDAERAKLSSSLREDERQIEALSNRLKCLQSEEGFKIKELQGLQEKLKELRVYQSTVSNEGFEQTVKKFQDLNLASEAGVETYQQLLRHIEQSHRRQYNWDEMTTLCELNRQEALENKEREAKFYRLRKARDNNVHLARVADSSKQHSQLFLGIVNLATQLSQHPICNLLLNVTLNESKAKLRKSRKQETATESNTDLTARWRKVALTALTEHRQVTSSSATMEVKPKVEVVKLLSPRKATLQQQQQDSGKSPRLKIIEERINKTAMQKLSIIEQILQDLSIVVSEIRYHEDPVLYNNPERSRLS